MPSNNLEKRRQDRQKKTAEIFTPPKIVRDMISQLPTEVWEKDKTFCDPACGNGNMLIMVLWKKISEGSSTLEALKTTYGVDIMKDNVAECRLRLLRVAALWGDVTEDHVKAVCNNIRWINPSKYPNGSLDYDFSFTPCLLSQDDIKQWLGRFQVEDVDSLPVAETSCALIDL